MIIKSDNLTNSAWISKLKEIIYKGQISNPRGLKIKELINSSICIDMNYPIISIPERKLGYKFMVREAWWIMSGRNDVESIKDYSKAISTFSNDSYHFDGAYGPRVVDQIRYIVDSLAQDINTRQAVLTIWRANPRASKDIPCTVSIQWLIRDGYIYCIDNMRSSDIWLGVPYDIFNFTMLTGYIMLLLKERGIYDLKLGKLYLNAGSQHLYEDNWEKANNLINNYREWDKIHKFEPYKFNSPIELKNYLKALSEINVKKLDLTEIDKYETNIGRDILLTSQYLK